MSELDLKRLYLRIILPGLGLHALAFERLPHILDFVHKGRYFNKLKTLAQINNLELLNGTEVSKLHNFLAKSEYNLRVVRLMILVTGTSNKCACK